jgi:hypothetical protein
MNQHLKRSKWESFAAKNVSVKKKLAKNEVYIELIRNAELGSILQTLLVLQQ